MLRFKMENGTDYPDWEEKPLNNYFSNIRNGFVGTVTECFSDKENGIRYLEGTNIHNGIISDNVEVYVTKEFHKSHIKSELKASDVVMVQSGHVGDCAVVGDKYSGSNCHALIIMNNNGHADSEYIVQYFHSPKGVKDISFLIKGNTVKHILASDINKHKIKFPCLEEQRKIADFLSSVDEIISATEKELEDYELQKKDVMQKIFSQEVRFKADDGSDYPDWIEVKLCDISNYSIEKINASSIKAKEYISTENILQNFNGIVDADVSPESGSLCRFRKNNVLMSNIRPYLKKIWLADRDGACNADVLIFVAKDETNPLFLYELLARNEFINYVMTGAKGVKMPRGDKRFIMEYRVPQICIKEQQKIADFLAAFDELIDETKKELECWKRIKNGLLQQMFV